MGETWAQGDRKVAKRDDRKRQKTAETSAAGAVAPSAGVAMPRWLREHSAPTNTTFFQRPFAMVGTIGVLCLLVVFSVRFMAAGPGIIATLWITSGVAVLAWVKSGRGIAHNAVFVGLVFMALMAGELILGNPPHRAILFVSLNLLEVVLGVAMLRYVFPRLDVQSVTGQVQLILLCMIATIPSSLLCGLLLHHGATEGYWGGVRMWWLGHSVGMLVVLAAGLSINREIFIQKRPVKRIVEIALLLGLLLGASLLVFSKSFLALGYLLLPILLLVAIRLRVSGTAVGLLIISAVAIKGTMSGAGPYHNMTPDQALAMAQMLVLLGYVPILLVAALLDERDVLAERARQGRKKAEMASAAKSRLLANVAHEIKSPVGGIIGIAEMWSSGHLGQVNDAQKEMADMMVRTGRQIENLAHDLLDVSQAESGAVRIELRATDVAGVLHDAIKTVSLMPEAAAMKLDILVAEPDLKVMADSQRLAQIIANLASNAVKYGSKGGFVRFMAVRSEPNMIRMIVEDGGPGLALEKQAQLFEPFNRLGLERSSIEGHGIGLALSKRLAELQNGRMGVVSQPGNGAAFWIELPEA